MLKKRLEILLGALAVAGAVYAEPLDRARVAADAKWVVHLDLEVFRSGQLGGYLATNFLHPMLDANAKKMNLDLRFENISALTAYGPALQKEADGVLLVATRGDLRKDLDTLVGLATIGEEGDTVKLVQQEPYFLYSFDDEVFFAPDAKGIVLVAKSKERIAGAREVLLGQAESLAQSQALADFPAAAPGFFFLGMVDGFAESAPIPPQAQVLRETQGGRLIIGEADRNLFMNLLFRGKNDQATVKIQQVLQGIVALFSLSQDNKDLQALAGATQISAAGRNVTVAMRVPVSTAIQKIEEKNRRKNEAKEPAHEGSKEGSKEAGESNADAKASAGEAR